MYSTSLALHYKVLFCKFYFAAVAHWIDWLNELFTCNPDYFPVAYKHSHFNFQCLINLVCEHYMTLCKTNVSIYPASSGICFAILLAVTFYFVSAESLDKFISCASFKSFMCNPNNNVLHMTQVPWGNLLITFHHSCVVPCTVINCILQTEPIS